MPVPVKTLLALFACAWAAAAHLKAAADPALVFPPEPGQAAEGGEPLPEGSVFERRSVGDRYQLRLVFRNFNQDQLDIRFAVPASVVTAADKEHGYSQKDLDAVFQANRAKGDAVYQRKLRDYLASRGFKLSKDGSVSVDMPAVVRRNTDRLNAAAAALDEEATRRGYDSAKILGAVTAMVQTALRYRVPPPAEGPRRTGGILTPPRSLVEGWGDCDTKTGLLASVLSNWEGMRGVGIAIPGHYLMAIERIPGRGDAYVEHEGVQYVLIEPAGPAWMPPGQVARETLDQLDSMSGVPIQPFS